MDIEGSTGLSLWKLAGISGAIYRDSVFDNQDSLGAIFLQLILVAWFKNLAVFDPLNDCILIIYFTDEFACIPLETLGWFEFLSELPFFCDIKYE